jgi:hypothetical protein
MKRLRITFVAASLACLAVAVALGVSQQLKHEWSRRSMEQFGKAIRESNRSRNDWNQKQADEAIKSGKPIAPPA